MRAETAIEANYQINLKRWLAFEFLSPRSIGLKSNRTVFAFSIELKAIRNGHQRGGAPTVRKRVTGRLRKNGSEWLDKIHARKMLEANG